MSLLATETSDFSFWLQVLEKTRQKPVCTQYTWLTSSEQLHPQAVYTARVKPEVSVNKKGGHECSQEDPVIALAAGFTITLLMELGDQIMGLIYTRDTVQQIYWQQRFLYRNECKQTELLQETSKLRGQCFWKREEVECNGWMTKKKSQRCGIVYLEQETMELGSLVCSPKEVWKLKEDGQTGRAKWYISLKESSAIKIEKKQLSSRKVLEHAQEHSDKYMGLQWMAKNKPDYTLR